MAAPRYIGKTAMASGTGALTVAALTGTQAGDLIVLVVEQANQTVTLPSEWTGNIVNGASVGGAGSAGGVGMQVRYRFLSDTADVTTTVPDSGDHTTAIKLLFRDTAGSSVLNGANTSTNNSTAMSWPSITTTVDGVMVLNIACIDTDAASTTTSGTPTNANLTSLTERHDQSVASGFGGGIVAITGIKNTAGATGSTTATGSTAVNRLYLTAGIAPVKNDTTFSPFVEGITYKYDVATTNYERLGEPLRIVTDASGTVVATAFCVEYYPTGGTTPPNGGYPINTRWYYRVYGTDTWTTTTATPQTTSTVYALGSLDTIGQFLDEKTITGLTPSTEYEFGLFAARNLATPTLTSGTNYFYFQVELEVSLPVTGPTGTLAVTETGSDTFVSDGDVIVKGNLSVAEAGSDTFVGSATTLTAITGNLAVTEVGSDTFVADASVLFPFTDSTGVYNTLTSSLQLPITEILQVRTNANGVLFFSGDITFAPQSLTNAIYNVAIQWEYRTVGGTWTTVGTEIASVQPAQVAEGVLEQVGLLNATASIGTLAANTNYEVRLLGRRLASLPSNTIEFFTGTVDATVSALSGTSTGHLFVSEVGSDTFAGTAFGLITATGNLNATETGSDTFSGIGQVLVKGSLAVSETGSDTLVSDGDVLVKATLAVTEVGSDTFSATAKNVSTANLSVTETGQDSFASTGQVFVKGSLNVTEATGDTFASNAQVLVQGSLNTAETGSDTFVGTATSSVLSTGNLNATEVGSDTFSATSAVVYGNTDTDTTYNTITNNVFAPITDVLYVRTGASGNLFFTGDFNFEPVDILDGTYDVKAIWRYRTVGGAWIDVGTEIFSVSTANVSGSSLTNVGQIDVATNLTGLSANTNYEVQLYARRLLNSPTNTIQFSASAVDATVTSLSPTLTGTLAVTEVGSDILTSTGQVLVKGNLSVSEVGADTLTSTAKTLVQGALAVSEVGADTFAATGQVLFSGGMNVTETGPDTFSSTAKVIVQATLNVTESGGPDIFAGVAKVIVKATLNVTESGSDVFAGTANVVGGGGTNVFFGDKAISSIYFGNKQIVHVYHGDKQIF